MTLVFGAIATVCAAALMAMMWADNRTQRGKERGDD